ncbi:hypothetical protein BH23THE1_BH23THE1_28270 [soil metagenome]
MDDMEAAMFLIVFIAVLISVISVDIFLLVHVSVEFVSSQHIPYDY